MKIYLSGPMKGYPNKNYPLFNKVANKLRELGHEVYNPAEFKYKGKEFPFRKAFAEYSKFICEEAEAIVMLPGHLQSTGATTELGLARNCKIQIIEWD
jgi:hypothetical protein